MKINIIIFLLFSQIVFPQSRNYEEVGLEHFVNEIVPEYYGNVDDFEFSGKITNAEPSYSFCLKLEYDKNIDLLSKNRIDISKYKHFSKNIGIFKKLYQSWKKRRKVTIYKHYPKDENYVVVIRSTSKYSDDYFSILIKGDKMEVIKDCLTSYDF
jgi:hypothetical protein